MPHYTVFTAQLVVLSVVAGVLTFGQGQPALPNLDCSSSQSDPRCGALKRDLVGKIGAGPAFSQGGFSEKITGGFVQGNQLIVAIDTLSDSDAFGAVFSVDLSTGNRTLISGLLNANERRGNGVMSESSRSNTPVEMYHLGGVSDVKPLPDGSYVASRRDGLLIRIEPGSGNRTLLWRNRPSDDTKVRDGVERKFASSSNGYFCPAAAPISGYTTPRMDAISVDAEGNIYLMVNNNPLGTGYGLYRLDRQDDYRCKAVSLYPANGGNNIAGSGVQWVGATVGTFPTYSMVLRGDSVFVSGGSTPNYMVIGINIRDGKRELVSGEGSGQWGRGSGNVQIGNSAGSLTFAGGALWATSARLVAAEGFGLTRIELTTGNRTRIDAKAGSLFRQGRENQQALFSLSSELFVVGFGSALHVFDVRSGNSYILSY